MHKFPHFSSVGYLKLYSKLICFNYDHRWMMRFSKPHTSQTDNFKQTDNIDLKINVQNLFKNLYDVNEKNHQSYWISEKKGTCVFYAYYLKASSIRLLDMSIYTCYNNTYHVENLYHQNISKIKTFKNESICSTVHYSYAVNYSHKWTSLLTYILYNRFTHINYFFFWWENIATFLNVYITSIIYYDIKILKSV